MGLVYGEERDRIFRASEINCDKLYRINISVLFRSKFSGFPADFTVFPFVINLYSWFIRVDRKMPSEMELESWIHT